MGDVLGPTQCSKSTKGIPPIVCVCSRKGDPFQDPKLCSYLTLGNELSEETHVLTKQETFLGRGAQAESSGVKEPRRTALLCGSQFGVLR